MAEGNTKGTPDGNVAWNALAQVVSDAETYKVNGTTTSGANGLSILYPRSLSNSELEKCLRLSFMSLMPQFCSYLKTGRTQVYPKCTSKHVCPDKLT